VIQIAQLTREVDFKRKTKVTLIATLISGTSGVTAAYCGFGVWSLVIQNLLNRFLITSGLWLTSKWKPAWKFSKESFKNMFSFGSWILFSSIIRRIFDNIYVLTIGKFFSAAQLGFYTKSKQFQRLSSEQFSQAVGVVAFPMFSQLQDDKIKLQHAMKKFLQHSLIFITPLMVTLIVVAKPFVILLLTEKWAPMIPYLQLLCVIGVLYPLHAVNIQVLIAQGKSNLNFRLDLIKNFLRIINIAIMYRFGVIYIILGELTLSFIALSINTYFTHKMINYSLIKQLNDIKKIIIGSIIAGFFGYCISIQFDRLFIGFFVGIIITFSAYVLFQYFLNYYLFQEVKSIKKYFIN
jgi:O-antigen/teichoic acid export membrane protein